MLVCKVHNTVLNGLRVKVVLTNKQRQDLNQKCFRDQLLSNHRLALKMLGNQAEIQQDLMLKSVFVFFIPSSMSEV